MSHGSGLLPAWTLVLWIGLLGADRIDFLAGGVDFVLTPFLVLTPVLLLVSGLRVASLRAPVPVPASFRWYLALLLALLSLALLSSLLADDSTTSLRRSVLLAAQMAGTLGVGLAILVDREPGAILARGAALGLLVALAFNAAELWAFLAGSPPPIAVGPASIDLTVPAYAGIFPRFSGQVADPNRAGLVFLLYVFLLARWGRRGRSRMTLLALGGLLLALTLSRSNLLAVALTAVVALLIDRGLRVSRPRVLTGCGIVTLLVGLFLVQPAVGTELARSVSPLRGRFALHEGSTRDHMRLIRRGVAESTRSVERAAIGVGYGGSFHLLQDMFPGNKYGNFHSLYVSFAAESGIFALLVILLLLGVPLLVSGPYRPLIAGIVVFNLFYQSAAEPAFWLALALAWLTLGNAGRRDGLDRVVEGPA